MMLINVRVIPRAKINKLEQALDGCVRIHTTAVPVGGGANGMVIKMLAEHYKIQKSRIKIIRGETSKNKIIEIPE